MTEGDNAISNHVVLLGPMGAGKTTVGRLVAERLGRSFVDSDEQILSLHCVSAAEIAISEGVDRLHKLEADALLTALDCTEPTVIAAAASTADGDDLLERLATPGTVVVLLDGDANVLRHRSSGGAHRREIDPAEANALARRRAARLEPLLAERVDVTTTSVEESATVVAKRINNGPETREKV